MATSQEEWSILWTTLPGEIEGGKTFLYHHINTNATNAHLVHPTQADYFRIKQWIRTCNEEHESCNEQGSDSAASLFGHSEFSLHVIDVELRRIVQCQHPVRYVALSYVWGASTNRRFALVDDPAGKTLSFAPGVRPLDSQPEDLIAGCLARTFEN